MIIDYNYDFTAILPPFDSHSTAIRAFDYLHYHHKPTYVGGCCIAA